MDRRSRLLDFNLLRGRPALVATQPFLCLLPDKAKRIRKAEHHVLDACKRAKVISWIGWHLVLVTDWLHELPMSGKAGREAAGSVRSTDG